ncbi:hypothetical protein RND81_03G101400 [Saponaria officinalis]|uniref:SWIM-type domain-containing protein n=1 Tax=Saponaria officinalis TaxID=3572 RepID=A0AAW1LZP8_SAPOF
MEGGGYENLPFNYRDMRNAINKERRKGRYRMPFSPFVGVNHRGSTVIFAAALVSYEDTETFEWVFEKWIECMGRAPTVMLTDQCKAVEGGIRKVFPDTNHRLCLWHILQNADKNLRSDPHFTAIDRDMRTLVHESITEEEFLNLWVEMVEKYNFQQNSLFIDQFEFALKRKAEEEKVLNFAEKNKPLKWDHGILFDDVFHKVYTNKKFQDVKDEVYGRINTNVETLPNSLGFVKMFRATSKVVDPFWKKERRCFDVSIDTMSSKYKCGCKLFKFKGILCRHIIKCLDVMDVNVIPDKYILARWRKDLVRGYENIRVGYYDPGQS